MTDYISREAAIEAIFGQFCASSDETEAALNSAVEDIKRITAADVRPVRRGKWSKEIHPNVRYNQYKCSICGEFSGHDSEGWIWKPNYCPNCGADMREES